VVQIDVGDFACAQEDDMAETPEVQEIARFREYAGAKRRQMEKLRSNLATSFPVNDQIARQMKKSLCPDTPAAVQTLAVLEAQQVLSTSITTVGVYCCADDVNMIPKLKQIVDHLFLHANRCYQRIQAMTKNNMWRSICQKILAKHSTVAQWVAKHRVQIRNTLGVVAVAGAAGLFIHFAPFIALCGAAFWGPGIALLACGLLWGAAHYLWMRNEKKKDELSRMVYRQVKELETGTVKESDLDKVLAFVKLVTEESSKTWNEVLPAEGYPACQICAVQLEKNDSLARALCGNEHKGVIYHRSCLDSWLLQQPTCPTCRGVCVSQACVF